MVKDHAWQEKVPHFKTLCDKLLSFELQLKYILGKDPISLMIYEMFILNLKLSKYSEELSLSEA